MNIIRTVRFGLLLSALPLFAFSQADHTPVHEYPYVDTYMDYRVYDLPARVAYVQRFGGWQRGDVQGLHRLLVTDGGTPLTGEQHLLYLQWVCNCADGVISTIPVSDLNREGPYIYTRPEVGQRGQTPFVSLTARNTQTGEISQMRVVVQQIGGYRVEYLED
ncbi:MAG: hypothetical protein WEB07_00045 [Natronospirillum sp.]